MVVLIFKTYPGFRFGVLSDFESINMLDVGCCDGFPAGIHAALVVEKRGN